MKLFLIILVIVALDLAGWLFVQQKYALSSRVKTASSQPAAKPSVCKTNKDTKAVIVSISQRHMWACDGSTLMYASAVITGNMNLAADLTPTGTYKIYQKTTDFFLDGHDSTGSWHDHVNYWMPFFNNQYGIYGFHDATWRANSDFGNISPYSAQASRGCVELPLAASAWLYNWSQLGTTVNIES